MYGACAGKRGSLFRPRPGSEGRANAPNERVNAQARTFGRFGKRMGVLGAGLAAYDILQSDNRLRTAMANAGSAVGGVIGGAGGAAAGAATGPLAVVAAPAGGVAGAMAGGGLGYDLGEIAYDYIADLVNNVRKWR